MAIRKADIDRMNKKDLSKWAPKRKAGDAFDESKLDYLLSEVREEGAEEARQIAIAQAVNPDVDITALIRGDSRTAEQQVARQLLMEGTMPASMPANVYRAEDLADKSIRGIAGPIQSDSTVRQSTTGGLVDGTLQIESRPIFTEYLTPQTEERLFQSWRALNPDEQQYARRNFNALGGEYYGQQMLKAMGASPVSDSDRSYKSQRARANATTMGTDRLIENSRGLLSPEIDRSGDYRYLSADGSVKVGDYQTGFTEMRGRPVDTVRLNLVKSLQGATPDELINFQQNYRNTARALQSAGMPATPDAVIGAMADVTLPPIKQGSEGEGIRGGKALSALNTFAEQNPDDQFRYDTVLYGLQTPGVRERPGGMLPEEVIFLDNRKTNSALESMRLIPEISRAGTEINVTPRIKDLAGYGAAARITRDPRIAQLLG